MLNHSIPAQLVTVERIRFCSLSRSQSKARHYFDKAAVSLARSSYTGWFLTTSLDRKNLTPTGLEGREKSWTVLAYHVKSVLAHSSRRVPGTLSDIGDWDGPDRRTVLVLIIIYLHT